MYLEIALCLLYSQFYALLFFFIIITRRECKFQLIQQFNMLNVDLISTFFRGQVQRGLHHITTLKLLNYVEK